MNKKLGKVLAAAAAGAAAGVAVKKLRDNKKEQEDARISAIEEAVMNNRDYGSRKAYLVGGGLATMAAAAYLVRDCKFPGKQITIYEGMHILGGSNDGIGTPEKGFVCRGGRMLNEETYENFWELFDSIPSLRQPGRSVTEEILSFDHAHPTCAKARLVDKDGVIQDVKSMGFNQADRMALLKLLLTDEKKLDNLTIQDWFKETPHMFETNFWYMWQTTFAFQKWSSLYEFRRYMNRMIFEFSRIETLEGVTRTPLNQYDSVIRPLEAYLRKAGVTFVENCEVTDIDFEDGHGITAKTLYLKRRVENTDDMGENGEAAAKDSYVFETVALNSNDICIMTNACMTDSATLGDFHTPAPMPVQKPISGELWAKVAAKKPGLGNPEPFFTKPYETNWLSFTVTCKGDAMLKVIEEFTGNVPGSGALMTFKDSSWLMSSVVAAQPHFVNQPMDTTIFWGYGLYTDAVGDYVKKPMKDCTGQELLNEYLHHLHIPEDQIAELMKTVINVIPCYMPYVDAQFEPRKYSDRPQVIPAGSTNFAMVSQFVEIPDDMVFTEEYSVRAARTAVYGLLDVKKTICPVTPYNRQPKILMKALKKAYL
ncbi:MULTISPECIES: oleate hydratase [Clostridia]|uniref:oleate hydratase n=1 Tax=Clostridia TaxID=186801 RepID=UPI0005D30F76|nr:MULTISPECIES: oleate hydratase [Clostridia]KJJ77852.1 oleate hydratase [Clostridium sp. FS41]MCB7064075.1 oleate hydratase [Enterocloster citroniae]